MKTYFRPYQTSNNRYIVQNTDGVDVMKQLKDKNGLTPYLIRSAWNNAQALEFDGTRWRKVDSQLYFNHTESSPVNEVQQPTEVSDETVEIREFIHNKSYDLKPEELLVSELKWKYAVRSVIRSQNVLMVGPTGSGKTMMVKWLAKALDRPLHIFNLGATQDPRATLIGNTHFDSDKGTYFAQSPFIKAIQEPNSIILLDELSRANPEAFNILMSVLDRNQRYVRIDESSDSPTIEVHPTVTFIGTANVGVEYTSTRVIDRALQDRFVTIQMDYLDKEGEVRLLSNLFGELPSSDIDRVADIVTLIRSDVEKEDGMLERNLSTRHSIEMASLLNDGFSMEEVLEIVVYPNYSTEGGLDSERTYVKQMIQSVMGSVSEEELMGGGNSTQF